MTATETASTTAYFRKRRLVPSSRSVWTHHPIHWTQVSAVDSAHQNVRGRGVRGRWRAVAAAGAAAVAAAAGAAARVAAVAAAGAAAVAAAAGAAAAVAAAGCVWVL